MLNALSTLGIAAALGLGLYAMTGGGEARAPAPVPKETLISLQTQVITETAPLMAIMPSDFDSAHIEWCMERYRSYNPRDNTFMSYSGVMRECDSPFW